MVPESERDLRVGLLDLFNRSPATPMPGMEQDACPFRSGQEQPVTDTANGRTDFVLVTPGTSVGFLVTKVVGKQGREVDVLPAKRVVTELNTMLLKQVLNIPVTEWETVVQPKGVLDDADWKSVAVGPAISHG